MLSKYALISSLVMVFSSAYAQVGKLGANDLNDSTLVEWMEKLYEPGVRISEDTIIISEETQRLITDETYRKIIYPETYTWDVTKALIQIGKMKAAFWYLINLYSMNESNRSLVLKSVIAYDKLFKMNEVLVSTFYTYCYTDPDIGTIVNGKPEITSPHILDEKFQAVKEILFYLDKYTAENTDK
jgi:hypothetical protein